MELLFVLLVGLVAVWLLGLHRPLQSAARSLDSLAVAGEAKAAKVEAAALKELASADSVTTEEIQTAQEKLQALRNLDI